MLTLQTEQLAKVTLAPRSVCIGTERGSSYGSAFGWPHDARRSRMQWRMRPTAADGGLTALRELKHAAAMGTPFPLVLLDAQMPDMDGLDAAAAIRERELGSGRRLPIVALTAHAMKGDEERCLAVGMDAYIAKPVDAKKLFAIIDRFFACSAPSAAATG